MFNNGYQAQFIAHYIAEILGHKKLSLIYDADSYGQTFAEGYRKAVSGMGLKLVYDWRVQPQLGSIEAALPDIVNALQNGKDPGIIFVALRDDAAKQLIIKLRDLGIKVPLVGGTSIGKQSFPEYFKQRANEQTSPGFYADNIYAASGLIYDIAGENTLRFQQRFYQRFDYSPDAASAAYYDAATLITKAIGQHYQEGTGTRTLRGLIRQYLQGIDSLTKAISGASGPFYFSIQGDAVKPLSMGRFRNNKLVSAPMQLYLSDRTPANREQKNNTSIQVGQQVMEKTNIVYTGISIEKISELNLSDFSHDIEFILWFRSSKDIRAEDIKFNNAIGEISLGKPIHQSSSQNEVYKAYRVKGRFKGDHQGDSKKYGVHILGLSFHHKRLTHNQLIYVKDLEGMQMTVDDTWSNRLKTQRKLTTDSRWRIDSASIFQNKGPQGLTGQSWLPRHGQKNQQHSHFNLIVRIKEPKLVLRELLPEPLQLPLLVAAMSLYLSLMCVRKYVSNFPKLVWFAKVLSVYLILICSEAISVHWLNPTLDDYSMDIMLNAFDSLWWICAAQLFLTGIKLIVWLPLEKKTGRKPPRIIHAILITLACTFAGFGIVAFVLGHQLTSLLATSGILAMIIGLAIQMNISNFFSGIAINIENPFRVGDYIKIDNYGEGYVLDITWRTTRLKTTSGKIISVPNTLSAESTVTNFTPKDEFYAVEFRICVDPSHSPYEVSKVLTEALTAAAQVNQRVVKDQEIDVGFEGVTDKGAEYQFYIKMLDFLPDDPATQAVYNSIWQHLNSAGIKQVTTRDWKLSHEYEK